LEKNSLHQKFGVFWYSKTTHRCLQSACYVPAFSLLKVIMICHSENHVMHDILLTSTIESRPGDRNVNWS